MKTPDLRASRHDYHIPAKFYSGTSNPKNVQEVDIKHPYIQHHILKIVLHNGKIEFAIKPGAPVTGYNNICEYALKVAGRKKYEASPEFSPWLKLFFDDIFKKLGFLTRDTPFDIKTEGGYQRWIVLELEDGFNWRFTPEGRGVTTELEPLDVNPSENHGLCFVTHSKVHGPEYPSNQQYLKAPPKGNSTNLKDWECKVVYWALSHRIDEDLRKFNFYIDFHQISGGTERALPIIFDPNVPNDGGGSLIPP